jgi:hypothetical protein
MKANFQGKLGSFSSYQAKLIGGDRSLPAVRSARFCAQVRNLARIQAASAVVMSSRERLI